MFKAYNVKSCQFECRLKHAIRKAKCIPWDYPRPIDKYEDFSRYEMCFGGENEQVGGASGLDEFDKVMNSNETLSECHCMPNCEQVTFETQVYTKNLTRLLN